MKLFAFTSAVVLSASLGVQAAEIQDGSLFFGEMWPGGSINFNPATDNTVVAEGIAVTSVLGQNTPLNTWSTLSFDNGSLSFTTGELVDSSGGTLNFAGGGSVEITDLVDGTNRMVLSGIFNETIVEVIQVGSGGTSSVKMIAETIFHKVDSDVAGHFGLPGGIDGSGADYEGAFTVMFQADNTIAGSADDGFTSSGMGVNTYSLKTAVPEPPAALVFATALIGIAAFAALRRRSLSPAHAHVR